MLQIEDKLEMVIDKFMRDTEESVLLSHNDRIDESIEVSLCDYSFIRNPETGHMFYVQYTYSGTRSSVQIKIKETDISYEEVREALENENAGFFDYIGETREKCFESLDNNHLASYIHSIQQHSGPVFFTEAQ